MDDQVFPPELVIVPAHPAVGRMEVEFETRTDDTGRDVLPAFSSVERLVQAFGPDQPWLALKLHTARELAITNGLADILIDPDLPADAWRWTFEDLERLDQSLHSTQSTDNPSTGNPRMANPRMANPRTDNPRR